MKGRALIHTAIDVGIGLLAATLLLIVAAAVHTIHSLVGAIFVAAGVIFGAALLRQLVRPEAAFASGLAVGAGSCIPVVLTGILLFSAGTRLVLWLAVLGFLLLALAGSLAGAALRHGRGLRAGLAFCVGCACAFGLVRTGQRTLAAYSTPVSQNRAAPDFVLTDTAGHAIPSSAFKNRIVVLDFWATWCAPCLREMPSVNRVRQSFQGNPNLLFYAVNPGWNEAGDASVKTFVAQHHLAVPLAFDEGGRAIHSFGATSLPFLVVLDKTGNIRMTASGFNTTDQLERDLTNKIREILAER